MQTTLDDQQALAELDLSRVRPFQLREYPGLIRLCSILLFLAIWEYYGRGVDPIFLSYPTAIARAAVQVTASGELGQQFLLSMKAFVIGFGSAIVLGIGVGLLMGRYRLAQYLLDPYMYAMDATPRVALIPLLLLWFGLGIWSKVAIVFLSGLFPILINTFSGVKTVSSSLVEIGQAYGAKEGQIFRKIIAPATLPFIMAGVRVGVGRAVVGIITAEMFTAVTGLGAMLIVYSSSFATDKLFVPIILLALLGVALTEVVKALQSWLAPWKESERAESE